MNHVFFTLIGLRFGIADLRFGVAVSTSALAAVDLRVLTAVLICAGFFGAAAFLTIVDFLVVVVFFTTGNFSFAAVNLPRTTGGDASAISIPNTSPSSEEIGRASCRERV